MEPRILPVPEPIEPWKLLAKRVSEEMDSKKLISLVDQLCKALDARKA